MQIVYIRVKYICTIALSILCVYGLSKEIHFIFKAGGGLVNSVL